MWHVPIGGRWRGSRSARVVGPDLIATNIWPEPPATQLRAVAIIPIVDHDIDGSWLLLLVNHLSMICADRVVPPHDDLTDRGILASTDVQRNGLLLLAKQRLAATSSSPSRRLLGSWRRLRRLQRGLAGLRGLLWCRGLARLPIGVLPPVSGRSSLRRRPPLWRPAARLPAAVIAIPAASALSIADTATATATAAAAAARRRRPTAAAWARAVGISAIVSPTTVVPSASRCGRWGRAATLAAFSAPSGTAITSAGWARVATVLVAIASIASAAVTPAVVVVVGATATTSSIAVVVIAPTAAAATTTAGWGLTAVSAVLAPPTTTATAVAVVPPGSHDDTSWLPCGPTARGHRAGRRGGSPPPGS
mmetsp:Transcript_138084/g.344789  ORF Transcript_138084/g.344789 Transcript_138084/m.344789 type:complete len:364 (-) Transcript_138084:7-1098(-)